MTPPMFEIRIALTWSLSSPMSLWASLSESNTVPVLSSWSMRRPEMPSSSSTLATLYIDGWFS